MNISAASKAAGLPVKTVRYYADIGLVEASSRSEAGYRSYDEVAVRKLVFARRSRAFGFSIEECRSFWGYIRIRTAQVLKSNALPQSGLRKSPSNNVSYNHYMMNWHTL